jgi:hypothetical protein
MKTFFCFSAFCLAMFGALTSSFAQPPDSLWARTYGGANEEIGYGVRQTGDSGYIVIGQTSSYGAGDQDIWLLKTDASGDSQWSRTFGGTGEDGAACVQITDGGYLLAGYSEPLGDSSRAWIIKTDSNGDSLWSRRWSRVSSASWAEPAPGGGYVVVGWIQVAGEKDVWLTKISASGDSLWSHSYGGPQEDGAFNVRRTHDGGYVLAGYTYSYGAGGNDWWLLKTDANGDSLWSHTFGGSGDDEAWGVWPTRDGGFLITGSGFTQLIKTDADGDSLWSRNFGLWKRPISVREIPGGNLLVAGQWEAEIITGPWLAELDSLGQLLWERLFFATNGMAFATEPTNDGGYAITGSVWNSTSMDLWLAKTGPELGVGDSFILHPSSFVLSVFPNPFNPSTEIRYDLPHAGNISLRVFDLLGREVSVLDDGFVEAGAHHVTFDGGNLSSGIYFARLQTGKFSQTRKLMLLK